MPFNKILGIPFKNDGIIKLLIGGVLGLIPIIGWFFAMGFMVKCYEQAINGQDELPEWSEWGGKFTEGLLVAVISLAYLLIPMLVMIPRINHYMYWGLDGSIIIPIILYIIFMFALPMAISNFAVQKSIGSGFQLGKIFKLIGAVPGSYIGAFFLYFFAYLIILIISMIPILGWILSIFMMFYLYCLSGFLFGSVYREAIQAVDGQVVYNPSSQEVAVAEEKNLCAECGNALSSNDQLCATCDRKVE